MFPVPILGDFIRATVTGCYALTELSAPLKWPRLPTPISRFPHPSESMESGLQVTRLVSVTLNGKTRYGFSAITQIRMRRCRSGRPLLSLNSIP